MFKPLLIVVVGIAAVLLITSCVDSYINSSFDGTELAVWEQGIVIQYDDDGNEVSRSEPTR